MEIHKATRRKAKLRIGLSGPSGSGKTYSALLMASGMAPWDKICLIDTENGSGELYSHLGAYNSITLEAPFTPERYIEAIKTCEQAGMEVIIIDSVSHEWEGKGGALEINEKMAQLKFKGNTWSAWSATTPRHQAFLESILQSSCHILTTARSKVETVFEGGKVKKVGMKEIQREGYEFEVTLNFILDKEGNMAIASKDRTGLFADGDPIRIDEQTGKKLLKWANEGQPELPRVKAEPTQVAQSPTVSSAPHLLALKKELARRGAKTAAEALEMLQKVAKDPSPQTLELTEEEASKYMIVLLQYREHAPVEAPKTEAPRVSMPSIPFDAEKLKSILGRLNTDAELNGVKAEINTALIDGEITNAHAGVLLGLVTDRVNEIKESAGVKSTKKSPKKSSND